MFDTKTKNNIEKNFSERLNCFSKFKIEIESKINLLDDLDLQVLAKYIYGSLPISDILNCDFEILVSFAKNALKTRQNTFWGKTYDIEMFLKYIVSPRINTEKLEDYRGFIFKELFPRIENKTDLEEIILDVNYWALEIGSYESTSERTASPLHFYKRSFGRCGEETTFLVSAYRSIGIPARQIYTPLWAHCDDCHAWVEVFYNSKWNYIGACEPEPVLNRGWFTAASKRAMLIHHRITDNIFNSSDRITNEGTIKTINLTKTYTTTKKIHFEFLENKVPIKNLNVHFQIINYGSFQDLCLVKSDMDGKITTEFGIGDINLFFVHENKIYEKIIHAEEDGEIVVEIDKMKCNLTSEDFLFSVPKDIGASTGELSKEQIELHKNKVKNANELRMKKIRNILSLEIEMPREFIEESNKFLSLSGLNGLEIKNFIEQNKNDEYVLEILRTLEEKDFSDISNIILKSHLEASKIFSKKLSKDIFVKYILNPRIGNEEITDYKSFIVNYFSEDERNNFISNPEEIFNFIHGNISSQEEFDFPNTFISPTQALKYKMANKKSKKILFVAIARSLGIPARLDPIYGFEQYLKDEKFVFANSEYNFFGRLKLKVNEEENFQYGTNWSIAKFDGESFQTLKLNCKPEDIEGLNLSVGTYRVLTCNRAPNGSSLCNKYYIPIEKDKTSCVEMKLKEIDFKLNYINVHLDDIQLKDLDDNQVRISKYNNKPRNIFIWLAEGEEPTEHILNEIYDDKEFYKSANVSINFVLKSKDALEDKNISRLIKSIESINIIIDDEFYNQEQIGRNLFVDPSKLPLVFLSDSSLVALYAISGYNVGISNMLMKMISSK